MRPRPPRALSDVVRHAVLEQLYAPRFTDQPPAQVDATELLATGPNRRWSWDIGKLRGSDRWTNYYLYVLLDVFRRYGVNRAVAHSEGARIAKALIADAVCAQGIEPRTFTIHAFRGCAMRNKTVAPLLCDLKVHKTHTRPHTSNDNPYSEAQFKAL